MCDLSERGAQPIVDSQLGLSVVLNGCIYNPRELRAELEEAGHVFFSSSDFEVITKAYAEWGERCVERFLGMFDFALVERDGGRLVLARDRLGIKPLCDAIAAMSEPMASHDAVVFFLRSEEISRSRKVVQSGQGADEVFGGYSWYPPMAGADGPGTDEYARVFYDREHEDLAEFLAEEHLVGEDVGRAFVDEHFSRPGADTPLDRALRIDTGKGCLLELWLQEQGL